jgi:hypothetical protein
VVMHIFQACPVWIYTQSNITSIITQNVLKLLQRYCFELMNLIGKITSQLSKLLSFKVVRQVC